MMVAESVRRKRKSSEVDDLRNIPESIRENYFRSARKDLFVPYLLVFRSRKRTSVMAVPGRARYLYRVDGGRAGEGPILVERESDRILGCR